MATTTIETTLNINEMFGHMAKVQFKPANYYNGKDNTLTLEGKIIYSYYDASLFFMPKGSRRQGYFINELNDIKSFEIIRKNNKENAYQNTLYSRKEEAEQYVKDQLERQEQEYKERERQRLENEERKRQEKEMAKQKELEEAASLCDYEKFKSEVISFYENSGEPYSDTTVENIMLPMLTKIVYKGISDITVYPKHFFDKKNNPRFCKLLEMKTGVKLVNTQKKNLEILNQYLQG